MSDINLIIAFIFLLWKSIAWMDWATAREQHEGGNEANIRHLDPLCNSLVMMSVQDAKGILLNIKGPYRCIFDVQFLNLTTCTLYICAKHFGEQMHCLYF